MESRFGFAKLQMITVLQQILDRLPPVHCHAISRAEIAHNVIVLIAP
jgi:hypothetical protein